MFDDVPDFTAILDDLYIGNLAIAKTLHEHPELGITHVLSVCPDYPEAAKPRHRATATFPTVLHPVHRCVPVEDTEYEDILVHLPSSVSFIRDALEPPQVAGKRRGQQTEAIWQDGKQEAELEWRRPTSRQKHKVLVHCVMGISRSTTVVCAYLMATRHLSFSAALTFIRKRRPRVHPNYGFRRQLQIFRDCGYFADYAAPIQTHPAYATWQRKKKREITKYLSRLENVVEIRLDGRTDPVLSLTDDFPTDPMEASSLLSEVDATHFLTISPASLPSSLTPPSSAALRARRPSGLLSPFMSSASSAASPPDSIAASPLSSRSSSFSNTSRLSSPASAPSTAATSVLSLTSLLPPSKLRLEVSSSDSEESENDELSVEPDYLALAGVEYFHIPIKDSDSAGFLLRMSEATGFIQYALDDTGSESKKDLNLGPRNETDDRRRHVLVHCSTESRACAVICAYLMSCKGLTPPQAYSVLERAQPLFNLTRSFVTLMELFHNCNYNPTLENPRVQAWISGAPRSPYARSNSNSNSTHSHSRAGAAAAASHKKVDPNADYEDSMSLQRKLGTPMRCGSFSHAYLQQTANGNGNANGSAIQGGQHLNSLALHANGSRAAVAAGGGTGGLDVGAMLQRFQGVGDPDFAFDVEAFRGALRGIAEDGGKKSDRVRGAR